MEERRPEKPLHQARARPDLDEVMPSASNTIPIALRRPTSAALNRTCTSTACATRPTVLFALVIYLLVLRPSRWIALILSVN